MPPEAAGTGPLPHSRMVGASPMAIDIDTFDVWYWGNGTLSEGRQLHPSSRLWATKDSGSILDDDNVGSWVESPAGEWCAEAVQPASMTACNGPVSLGCAFRLMRLQRFCQGNLEVWKAELSGHRAPPRSLLASGLHSSKSASDIVAGRAGGVAPQPLSDRTEHNCGVVGAGARGRRATLCAGRVGGCGGWGGGGAVQRGGTGLGGGAARAQLSALCTGTQSAQDRMHSGVRYIRACIRACIC